jgi:hypothetical protein
MNQSEIFDRDIRERDIRALQEWLRSAWRRLGDPTLTAFTRRELRNQMKQCSADLKAHLERAEALQQSPPPRDFNRPVTRPDLRILA